MKDIHIIRLGPEIAPKINTNLIVFLKVIFGSALCIGLQLESVIFIYISADNSD